MPRPQCPTIYHLLTLLFTQKQMSVLPFIQTMDIQTSQCWKYIDLLKRSVLQSSSHHQIATLHGVGGKLNIELSIAQ